MKGTNGHAQGDAATIEGIDATIEVVDRRLSALQQTLEVLKRAREVAMGAAQVVAAVEGHTHAAAPAHAPHIGRPSMLTKVEHAITGRKRAAAVGALMAQVGASQTTVNGHLRQLIAEGKVVRERYGRYRAAP